ncbi:MAG: ribonuclease J [Proteobacteria bacterium]|nr:ribonuclease J [Pseudomonadota bacterium]
MTRVKAAAPVGTDGALYFLPLGGSGEIGMNLNLYFYAGRWLMVDLGVTFSDEGVPGAEVIMPDPKFIEERRDALIGLVLTHAHEDHLGAVAYMWPRLRCPVYATGFAASVLRRKLQETGLAGQVPLTVLPLGTRFKLGPFDIELISITHSIPEPNALAIRTPAGTVLHTGDWKIDPTPLIGPVTDENALRRVGAEGVLALIGDSTNALKPGRSGSEAEVRAILTELFGRFRQRIAVACFASNIARLETISAAAAANGRQVALVGRSLVRMDEAARENGYLRDTPPFLNEYDAGHVPRDRIVLICTGSQGEPRAALARIAADTHPHIALEPNDVIIFSSRMIPGNERVILRLQDELARRGVEVITDADHPVHVSGHPARDELTQMYQWIRPRIAVPVHGEARHMHAHAELAKACQVPFALVPENGTLIRLAPDGPEIVERVHAGRLAVDGQRLVPVGGAVMRSRARMMWSGVVIATVVVDRKGRLLASPQLSAPGLIDPEADQEFHAEIVEAIEHSIADLSPKAADDDIGGAAQRAIRRTVKRRHGKKPVTEVHVVRV